MSKFKHIGYDRDGDKVWEVAPGMVIGGRIDDADVRRAMAERGWEPFTISAYASCWGPITKEKS